MNKLIKEAILDYLHKDTDMATFLEKHMLLMQKKTVEDMRALVPEPLFFKDALTMINASRMKIGQFRGRKQCIDETLANIDNYIKAL